MTEAQDTQPQAQPVTAGALLREARESRAIAIEMLANSIKISVQQLQDLESDHYDRLSDAAFVRALALSVCRAMKMDPAPALALLPEPASVSLLAKVNEGINVPFESRGTLGVLGDLWQAVVTPHVATWVFLLVLVGALWALWPALKSVESHHAAPAPAVSARSKTLAPPPQAAVRPAIAPSAAGMGPLVTPAPSASGPAAQLMASAPVPAASKTAPAPTAAAPQPASAAPPGVSAHVVRIAVQSSSWVEVRKGSGAPVVSRLLGAHEQLEIEVAPPLSITIGNAPDTQLVYGGRTIDLAPYTRDHVAHVELK